MIWMPGALLLPVVYQHSPWIHKQFYRGKVVYSGTVYVEEGDQASRLTQAKGKGRFHVQYSFQNTKVFHAR